MFSDHYDGWIVSRMEGVKKYIKPDFFKDKTVLEVGCGFAHVGNEFSKLGAIVTSSDARASHLVTAQKLYPHIKTFAFDGDKNELTEKYDIIVHWGLLYHLKEIENHLMKLTSHCDVLLLETEVSDTTDENFALKIREKGYDQAFNGEGIRPSPTYVEKVLAKCGFQFKMIKDPILNASFHKYDWEVTGTKTSRHGLRRYWICWKDVESPLIK
jgi:hypothetical protein